MAWNGNFTSLDRVIEKVFQKAGYDDEFDWADALEWTGEAVALIGAPQMYIDKLTGDHPLTPNVVVTAYKGELPIDFVALLPAGVRDFETTEVYRYATDTFVAAPATQVVDSSGTPSDRTIHTINPNKVYSLNDSYIFTNEESVTLELAYKAFMIDDRGFPMIPDNERVLQAIVARIIMGVDYRLWRKNKISTEVYRDSEREWLWYVGSAGTAMRTPHPDRKESWTKALVRLNPVINSHMTSFKFAGNQEDLNIGSGNDGSTY
jgi:hypothetical protein